VGHERRLFCPNAICPTESWSEIDTRIGFLRPLVPFRAARWLTQQVGKKSRSVQEISNELDCGCHAVNHTPSLRRGPD
jgi:hypothetical protein